MLSFLGWCFAWVFLRHTYPWRIGILGFRFFSEKIMNIQSFKVGRVGDDELFGKLRINVSQCLNAQAKLGRRPLRSSVAAGTSS